MLLSLTRPQLIPGISLSVCICLSCRRNKAAEPGVEDMDMSLVEEKKVAEKLKLFSAGDGVEQCGWWPGSIRENEP